MDELYTFMDELFVCEMIAIKRFWKPKTNLLSHRTHESGIRAWLGWAFCLGLTWLLSGSTQAPFSSEAWGLLKSSCDCWHILALLGSVFRDLLSVWPILKQFTRPFASSRIASPSLLHMKHDKDMKYCNLPSAATSVSSPLCFPGKGWAHVGKMGVGVGLWIVVLSSLLSQVPFSSYNSFPELNNLCLN